MNHLFVGVDAEIQCPHGALCTQLLPLGRSAGRGVEAPANPWPRWIIAPNIGFPWAGDITAGTMASMIWDKDELSLFIDLGTNGEIVFGNRDFLMSCACSAGPAF